MKVFVTLFGDVFDVETCVGVYTTLEQAQKAAEAYVAHEDFAVEPEEFIPPDWSNSPYCWEGSVHRDFWLRIEEHEMVI